MQCPECHFVGIKEDEYCRQCGAEFLSSATSMVPRRTMLPTVLQNIQLPQKVVASIGALALGVGLELLRRSLQSHRTRPAHQVGYALPDLNEIKDILPLQNKAMKPPRGYEIHETVVYMRRVLRKAD